MKRNILGVIGLLFISVTVGINTPAHAAPSSYQKTCSDISINGNQLSATCQTRNGASRQTSIVIRGIENINGNLQVTNPNQVSSYQKTCSNIDINGRQIKATCQTRNGRSKQTSIVLRGIENIDGYLKYTSSP